MSREEGRGRCGVSAEGNGLWGRRGSLGRGREAAAGLGLLGIRNGRKKRGEVPAFDREEEGGPTCKADGRN